MELGFRSGADGFTVAQSVTNESLMITGDENIVDVQAVDTSYYQRPAYHRFAGPSNLLATVELTAGRHLICEHLLGKYELIRDHSSHF
jgi:hypothetical protein